MSSRHRCIILLYTNNYAYINVCHCVNREQKIMYKYKKTANNEKAPEFLWMHGVKKVHNTRAEQHISIIKQKQKISDKHVIIAGPI